jgi:hypothetical protein
LGLAGTQVLTALLKPQAGHQHRLELPMHLVEAVGQETLAVVLKLVVAPVVLVAPLWSVQSHPQRRPMHCPSRDLQTTVEGLTETLMVQVVAGLEVRHSPCPGFTAKILVTSQTEARPSQYLAMSWLAVVQVGLVALTTQSVVELWAEATLQHVLQPQILVAAVAQGQHLQEQAQEQTVL